MSNFIFIFNLDSTVTGEEILPKIAKEIGKYEEICALTDKAMSGEIPFKQSFLEKVEIMRNIPVSKVNTIIRDITLNEKIVNFILKNRSRCFIITGNLDIWIHGLMVDLGLEKNYFSSKAIANNDYFERVVSVIDKNIFINQFITPIVAIGDGHNDAEMIEYADIGIGYGGVRNISPAVLHCASHAVYEEETLCRFLERLL